VALPGFTISLPPGVVIKQTRAASVGSYKLDLRPPWLASIPLKRVRILFPSRGQIHVSWEAMQLTAEDQTMRREAVVGTVGKRLRTVELDASRRIDVVELRSPEVPVALGDVYCEQGLAVSVVLSLRSRDVEAMIRELTAVLRSVRCPNAPVDAKPPEPVLLLAESFGQVPKPPTDPKHYISLDGTQVVVSVTHGDALQAPDYAQTFFDNMYAQIFSIPKAEVRSSFRRLERKDGRPSGFYQSELPLGGPNSASIVTLFCEDIDITFIVQIFERPAARPLAHAMSSRIGCPAGPPAKVRSVSEVFGEACARGEAQPCADLAAYVEEGMALDDKGSSESFRRRACELGLASACPT
jgi:hypothetical protein